MKWEGRHLHPPHMPGRTDNAPESWQRYGGGRGQVPSRKKSTRPENEESRRAAGLSQSLEIPLPPGARHERLGSCSLPPTNWVGPFFFLLLFSLNEGFSTRNSPANGLRGGKKSHSQWSDYTRNNTIISCLALQAPLSVSHDLVQSWHSPQRAEPCARA